MSNPNGRDPYAPRDEDDRINGLIEKCKPILQKFTFSSIMGYCSGITAKTVGKGVALLVGLAFVGLQGLVYNGLIDVDWKKVEGTVVNAIDTDNDGKLTGDDLKTYWSKLKRILTKNLPDASGFSVGFFYGLKSG